MRKIFNLIQNFRSKYPNWSLPTKISIWTGLITVIGVALGIFFYFNPNYPPRPSSNFLTSRLVDVNGDSTCPANYVLDLTTQNIFLNTENIKIRLLNMKFVLASNQEAYIKNFTNDKTFHIGRCNDDMSNCCINPRNMFKKEYQICFVDASQNDFEKRTFLGPNFTKSSSCYEVINGSVDFVNKIFDKVPFYEK